MKGTEMKRKREEAERQLAKEIKQEHKHKTIIR